MKKRGITICTTALAAIALIVAAPNAMIRTADADVTVGVDKDDAPWLGFMNVFELDRTIPKPADPVKGDFVFGDGWGVPDLTAEYTPKAPGTLGTWTLGPNTVADPDPFWYLNGAGSPGNKWMDASMFQQIDDGSFSGMNVTFEGTIWSNTLTSRHTATAFVRDFAPDFSSFTENTVALTGPTFSVTLATDADPLRHVQYGFNVQGENVWSTDVAPFGTVVIHAVNAIPEPGSLMLLGLGAIGLISRRRR